MVNLKSVTVTHKNGTTALKRVSLRIDDGEFVLINGHSGAGKSTIINLMARLYDVTGGEITIDGVPIRKIAFEDLRRNIGIVSQETYLFIGSIADNIRYADPEASMEEVIEAAKSANAHEFITKLPEGYNTRVGEGGISLSGGEKQRISIARAIIQKPNVLILDEATAAMDTRTERKIQAAIDNLKQGRTIISIAHRLSTLRDADMLCVIENGELKESGTHDELIRRNISPGGSADLLAAALMQVYYIKQHYKELPQPAMKANGAHTRLKDDKYAWPDDSAFFDGEKPKQIHNGGKKKK